MKNLDEIYERFGQLLEEERPDSDPACTFAGICSRLGVEPGVLEEYIYSQVGMSGEEVLEAYRRSEASGASDE